MCVCFVKKKSKSKRAVAIVLKNEYYNIIYYLNFTR